MVKRIVKSIYLVLTPLQKRLLRKVPWAKFGFLFLGGKICIFNIRDGEERERKKKFCSDWQYRQWLIDLLFFSRAFERLARLLARTLPLKTNAHYDTKYHHSSRQKLDCCSPPSPRLGHGRGDGGLTEILQRSSKDSLGKKPSLEPLLWKTKNERIWECHGFCLAASGKFCSVWNFSVAVLESSGFTVSSPSIAFQLFIGVRAQNSSVVE